LVATSPRSAVAAESASRFIDPGDGARQNAP
jgi:hypothetical protein